jgi:hypothetical protein
LRVVEMPTVSGPGDGVDHGGLERSVHRGRKKRREDSSCTLTP